MIVNPDNQFLNKYVNGNHSQTIIKMEKSYYFNPNYSPKKAVNMCLTRITHRNSQGNMAQKVTMLRSSIYLNMTDFTDMKFF